MVFIFIVVFFLWLIGSLAKSRAGHSASPRVSQAWHQLLLSLGISIFFMAFSSAFFRLSVSAFWRGGYLSSCLLAFSVRRAVRFIQRRANWILGGWNSRLRSETSASQGR
jgi:hypothetical protein